MNNKKRVWQKPACNTIKKEQIEKSISISACSKYMSGECITGTIYLDSFPGNGKPIFM